MEVAGTSSLQDSFCVGLWVCLSNVPSAQTIQKDMDRTWITHGERRNVQIFRSKNSRQITRVTYAYRQHGRLKNGTRIYLQPNRIRDETNNNNSMSLVRKRTIPTERPPLSAKLVPTFADRGCRVVSEADPYGRNLGFLDRSRYSATSLPSSSSVILTRLSGPRSKPTTSQKIW
jgi:hypothetical protein